MIDPNELKVGDVVVLSKDVHFESRDENDVGVHGIIISFWENNFEGKIIKLSKKDIKSIKENNGCIILGSRAGANYYIPCQSFRYDISHKLKLL